ncbi:unnamed protein product, partial [Didymodactylos carnosus]
PAIATGSVSLKVSRDIYKLNVLINTKEADESFTPSSIIHIGVDVTQHTNNAAVDKVEVCLIIVDEAILSLTGHTLLSPLDIFYPDRSRNIIHYHDRNRCLLFNMQDTEKFKKDMQKRQARFKLLGMAMEHLEPLMTECASGMYLGDNDEEQKIAVRSNFNPLAHWIPSAITNSSGHATFEVKLPDNLTRYR